MKFLLVLAAVVLCAAAKAVSEVESPFVTLQEHNLEAEKNEDDSNSRIVGGSPASAGQFPWQVAVRYRTSSGNFFCGGSLISTQWVLTAAHCAVGAIQFTLQLGGITQSASESGRIQVTSTNAIIHERYNSNNLNNDIALIRLPSPVTLTQRIRTIRLPSRGSTVGGNVRVTVSGWGRTSDSSTSISNVLNFVQLTTITNNQCAAVYGSSTVIASTICAVGNPFQSTCSGDSGGPLVVYDNSGTATQIGVVSFVHRAGCASGNPSGYVRTVNYLDWISSNTGINFG